MQVIQRLQKLESGRTFVCSDIHGCFSLLEQKLEAVAFNEMTDRLVCVGDLIDRGPESERALEFLAKPWFYSVMGNHEAVLLDVLSGNMSMYSTWMAEGGAWFNSVSSEDRVSRWEAEISKLPLVIEIETQAGLVGIVHADVPKGTSWNRFIKLVEQGDQSAVGRALKSRFRVSSRLCEEVSGVYRIYCGHTYVPEPRLQGNIWCIDTGAYMGEGEGDLTLIEVDHGG